MKTAQQFIQSNGLYEFIGGDNKYLVTPDQMDEHAAQVAQEFAEWAFVRYKRVKAHWYDLLTGEKIKQTSIVYNRFVKEVAGKKKRSGAGDKTHDEALKIRAVNDWYNNMDKPIKTTADRHGITVTTLSSWITAYWLEAKTPRI